jgi:hypothetical protein
MRGLRPAGQSGPELIIPMPAHIFLSVGYGLRHDRSLWGV